MIKVNKKMHNYRVSGEGTINYGSIVTTGGARAKIRKFAQN
jgi:hypothetical protein